MSQSLARILVHIVFSTRYRQPVILPDVRAELNAYMGGALNNIKCHPIQINCVSDHMHILCCQSRNISAADMLEEIKKSSSKWLKTKSPALSEFYWQGGYSIMSVSQSRVEDVRRYILNQEVHHHRMGFQDELRELLKRNQIEFDEKYIWD